MRPARILLLLVAIMAGGLAAFLATRGSGPATVVQEIAAQAPQTGTKVLVAKDAIGVGQRLTANDVEWQPWPDASVRPEYITIAQTPDAQGKISGAVARFEIFQGEPILDQKLVHSDQGFLSAVLDPGMRGVSVQVTASSGSGGFIIPNDRVDVVQTETQSGQTTSRVVLSDVKVLAIGTRLGQSGTTGTPAGDPTDPKSQIFTSDSIATLELSPPQADTLINATATGKISLLLRSVADFGKSVPAADTSDDNQSIKVIRFGREANFTSGSADQGQASISPAAFTAPASDIPTQPITVAPPGTTVNNANGSVTVAAPAVPLSTSSDLPLPAQSLPSVN
jgi:pilus assembly protein CpaB